MEVRTKTLSIAEIYVIGIEKYGDSQTGIENWNKDLLKFVSKEFHNQLNSQDRLVQKQANDEVSLWVATTEISYFFRKTWGKDITKKAKALQYLHNALLLERKFNDQYVIQVINKSIRACLENKYVTLE